MVSNNMQRLLPSPLAGRPTARARVCGLTATARRYRYAALLTAGAAAVFFLSGESDFQSAARTMPSLSDDTSAPWEATGHIRELVEAAVAEAEAEAEAESERAKREQASSSEWRGPLSRLAAGVAARIIPPRNKRKGGDQKKKWKRSPSSSSVRDSSDGRGRRPAMHTFYRRLDDGSTGMSPSSDVKLLTAWASAWYSAGWDPVILTMRDVRRHPYYEKHRGFLDENPYEEYNTVCFWRWFAMATVDGGGWMSDFDVFPLYDFADFTEAEDESENSLALPNGGNLTVHFGNVPELVSGRQSEWDRMAALLVKNAERRYKADGGGGWDEGNPYSDMHALGEMLHSSELGIKPPQYNVTSRSMLARKFFEMEPFDANGYCDDLREEGIMAVHFAHSALKWAVEEPGRPLYDGGKTTVDTVIEKRAEICEEWIGRWRKACGTQEDPGPKSSSTGKIDGTAKLAAK